MINEDITWFNQVLLTYKDIHYGTGGYLRISTVTSSKDLKSFNQTNISLSISNNIQKNCFFHHYDSVKLLKSFEQFIESLKLKSPFSATITQKMKDQQLHFIFFLGENEPLVKIQLISNETDMVSCIIPFFGYFESFMRILKQYVENYLLYSTAFVQTILMTTVIDSVEQIPLLVRGAVSQLTSGVVAPRPVDSVAQDIVQEAQKTEMTIQDLDKFLGEDMKNIKVPEIDEEKITEKLETKPVEVNSFLLEKVLKWDLHNLENMLASYSLQPYPIEEFSKRLSELIQDESFIPLVGIDQTDLKSLLYMSKFTHQSLDIFATEYGAIIPNSFSILKYKTSFHSSLNLEIALDLFLLGGFIRAFRRKMEGKMSSRTRESNGVNFHMNFRLFTDPFVFSFIDQFDKTILKGTILNRYKYFDQKGVFTYYKKYLEDHNCIAISISDIDWYVTEISEKVLGKGPFIDELHKAEYERGSLKIPYLNSLNKEQIIKEVIPLEIKMVIEKDLDPDLLVSKDIMDYFKKAIKVEKLTQLSDRNNLLRFIKPYEKQIPERYRVEFMKNLERYSNKNFILDETYPYQEFGDEVVKLLHLWKPEEDEKLAKNYKYLSEKFDNMIQTKETILSLNPSNSKKQEEYDHVQW